MKTLIVVDFQKDFANPNGSLYVKGAEEAKQAIIDYINANHDSIYDVIFTVDWHSPNHCSFKKEGGEWPVHCVQFSEGAGIDDDIMKLCIDYDIYVRIFKKGNIYNQEEYGAFKFINHYIVNGENIVTTNNDAQNNSMEFKTFNLVVCGIAGDYCVKESIKNLLKYNGPVEMNIEVLKDGVASIDHGKTFDEFIKENNLKVV